MANVVIFGLRDFASLAHFYLTNDSGHEVVAFCVDERFLPEPPVFEGKPVVPFEEVTELYPPEENQFFAPLSEKNMNQMRAEIYWRIKDSGYGFISYISSRATVFPEAVIGENCFILENNTIQPFTPIGNNVVMGSGNHIGHHGQIDDHVFFTSHVVVLARCYVGAYAFFGASSTIQKSVVIGEGTLVSMSASIVKDTQAWSVYKGLPAKKARVMSRDLNF